MSLDNLVKFKEYWLNINCPLSLNTLPVPFPLIPSLSPFPQYPPFPLSLDTLTVPFPSIPSLSPFLLYPPCPISLNTLPVPFPSIPSLSPFSLDTLPVPFSFHYLLKYISFPFLSFLPPPLLPILPSFTPLGAIHLVPISWKFLFQNSLSDHLFNTVSLNCLI